MVLLPLLSIWEHHEQLSWHSLKSHRDTISPLVLRHDDRMQAFDTNNKDIHRCLPFQLCISTQAPKGTRTCTVLEKAFWPSVGHCRRNSRFKCRITKGYTSARQNANVLTVLEETIMSVAMMADITPRRVEIWGQSACCSSFPKPVPEFHLERPPCGGDSWTAQGFLHSFSQPMKSIRSQWKLLCLCSPPMLFPFPHRLFCCIDSLLFLLDSFSYSPELGCHVVASFCSCFFIKVLLLSIKRPLFEQVHRGE